MARKSMIGAPVGEVSQVTVEAKAEVAEVAVEAAEEEAVAEEAPAPANNDQYRVAKACWVVLDGQRVPFREGKLITPAAYDIEKILSQGVELRKV